MFFTICGINVKKSLPFCEEVYANDSKTAEIIMLRSEDVGTLVITGVFKGRQANLRSIATDPKIPIAKTIADNHLEMIKRQKRIEAANKILNDPEASIAEKKIAIDVLQQNFFE